MYLDISYMCLCYHTMQALYIRTVYRPYRTEPEAPDPVPLLASGC